MKRAGRIVLLGGLGVAALGLAGGKVLPPILIWNATASAPIGFYGLRLHGAAGVGDWVAVRPAPAWACWLDERGYLPSGALLIKQIAAVHPSRVCRDGARVMIDGRLTATAERTDRWGRDLPVWSGCVHVAPDRVFLLNAAPRSLDGRYFGPIDRSLIVGQATRILTWETR